MHISTFGFTDISMKSEECTLSTWIHNDKYHRKILEKNPYFPPNFPMIYVSEGHMYILCNFTRTQIQRIKKTDHYGNYAYLMIYSQNCSVEIREIESFPLYVFMRYLMHLAIFLVEYPNYSPGLVLVLYLNVGIPPLENQYLSTFKIPLEQRYQRIFLVSCNSTLRCFKICGL